MAKLCKCGLIHNERQCPKCYKQLDKQRGTTKQRGYGHDHRTASERYREEHPLCECCVCERGVVGANATEAMHHIIKVAVDSTQRMKRHNWLAVCEECHQALENDVDRALKVKRWSEVSYERVMAG